MKELPISREMSGQKLDRLLENYLKNAGRNFIYRMLRKKNITLNGKKATGHETLKEGDVVRIWFSDETLEKMSGTAAGAVEVSVPDYPVTTLDILYEDEDVLIVNKPTGMLSQKAGREDVSLNEYAIGYLLEKGALTKDALGMVKPSVCNRLDRNTSGIVCIGKTQTGLRVLSGLFKGRSVHKYYHCLVLGRIDEDLILTGYLKRDRSKNISQISDDEEGSAPVETRVHPLRTVRDRSGRELTLLEVRLITGRTHQIRAQLSAVSHPLIGDPKYGDRAVNSDYRQRFDLNCQLLHCAKIIFPTSKEDPVMEEIPLLEGKTITCPEGEIFEKVLRSLNDNL